MGHKAEITAFTASLHQRDQPADGFRGLRDDGGSGEEGSRQPSITHRILSIRYGYPAPRTPQDTYGPPESFKPRSDRLQAEIRWQSQASESGYR